MSRQEVISRFLDGEPFDAAALGAALGEPEGREFLLDLISLRNIVQEEEIPAAASSRRRFAGGTARWAFAATAAAVIALAGGYALGARSTRASVTAETKAPAPTAVVKLENGVNWTESKGSH
jgi:hypothetical protein